MYCTNPSPRAAAASGRAAAPAAIVAAAGQNKPLAAPSTTTRSCDCDIFSQLRQKGVKETPGLEPGLSP